MEVIALTSRTDITMPFITKVSKTPTPGFGLWVTDPQSAHEHDAELYIAPFIDDRLFNLTKPYIPCCGTPTEVYTCINKGCTKIWLDDYTKLELFQSLFTCKFFVICPLEKVMYIYRRGADMIVIDQSNMDNLLSAYWNIRRCGTLRSKAVII